MLHVAILALALGVLFFAYHLYNSTWYSFNLDSFAPWRRRVIKGAFWTACIAAFSYVMLWIAALVGAVLSPLGASEDLANGVSGVLTVLAVVFLGVRHYARDHAQMLLRGIETSAAWHSAFLALARRLATWRHGSGWGCGHTAREARAYRRLYLRLMAEGADASSAPIADSRLIKLNVWPDMGITDEPYIWRTVARHFRRRVLEEPLGAWVPSEVLATISSDDAEEI